MAIDRNRLHVLGRGHINWTRWRWLIRSMTVSLGVASLIVFLLDSGPVQLVARVAFTVVVVVVGGAHALDILRGARAYEWDRWGRFAWMQYVALAAGLLLEFSVMYVVLLIMYPALRPTPMTNVALATILALGVFAFALLVLLGLVVLVVLFCLPVVIVRARLRERRRRHYRFPAH